MLWTREQDLLLIRLWEEGGSLAHVAEGMSQAGYNVSRNAIAGRKHRLAEMDVKFVRPANSYAISSINPNKQGPLKTTPKRSTPVTEPKITIEQLQEQVRKHEGVDYLQNSSIGCKAIMDDCERGEWDLKRVCGKPRVSLGGGLSPYCRMHLRLFTNTQPAPRRNHA